MADKTGIEWTDATWNPIRGCSRVSEGCRNCYAETVAARFSGAGQPYHGVADRSRSGSKWTGEVKVIYEMIDQPLRWRRPRRIFVNSMSDLFHEKLPDEAIDLIFAVMALAPQHTFQVLTKRSPRMRAYLTDPQTPGRVAARIVSRRKDDRAVGPLPHLDGGQRWWPLANVWIGVSVEDQATADARIPDLLASPAKLRFISAEPLLGPVSLETAWHGESALDAECWGDCAWCSKGFTPLHNCQSGKQSEDAFFRGRSGIDWVICGGESGRGARPMHPDWAMSLRAECEAAGVPFFFKQWGEWAPDISGNLVKPDGTLAGSSDGSPSECIDAGAAWMQLVGKKAAGHRLAGGLYRDFPDDHRSTMA